MARPKSFAFGIQSEKHDGDQEKLLESDQEDNHGGSPRHSQRSLTERLHIPIQLLAVFTIGLVLGHILGTRWTTAHDLALRYLALTSRPSPLTPTIPITYSTQRFNGSLIKENIYRMPGSAEVDAAWEALGVNYRSAVIPTEEGERVGLEQDQVQVREKYGGGFPVNVEGLHQLHCLNLVRQTVYYNYEYYRAKGEGGFANSDFVLQKHVSHCIDIIRQQLMCTVDIGVLGQVWFQPPDQDYPNAYVDFNTRHVCRNFEDVRRWAEEHQAPEDVPADFLEPPKEGDRVYSEIP